MTNRSPEFDATWVCSVDLLHFVADVVNIDILHILNPDHQQLIRNAIPLKLPYNYLQ